MRKTPALVVLPAGAALCATALLGSCAAPTDSAVPHPSSSFSLPLTADVQTGGGGGGSGGGGGGAASPGVGAPRTTKPFSMVGVVWNDATEPLGATVRVRTHHRAGAWSGWLTLDTTDADTPSPAANGGRAALGGTPPLWVGPSDGVQVDVEPDRLSQARQPVKDGTPLAASLPSSVQPLPAGLRLELVDGGQGGDGSGTLTAGSAGASGRPYAGPYRAVEPQIVPRSVWQPDSPPPDTPIQYADVVRAIFIHHTDSGNGYDCRQTPEVIRSIEEYHVKDRAYDDIGYNFLVDRCGTVYEGRPGGVARPVIGAHTLGFNIGTAGIAAIGSFPEGVSVPKPMLEAIERLIAWKLGLAGIDPRGTVRLTSSDDGARVPKGQSKVFNTVSGHRDGGWTFCPGGGLYADLPQIRAAAARLQGRTGQ
ncbi:peptidoglycan recognition protein family protein [Phaeacidiphilus oryzae]|uniref:peptidoglycan recognition protein family protein n=1 Tax=Phaeacidiphilus oryzae TaxID=348818 RepID=UPI000A05F508|nr:peptidoglycan recognition protein [Phaeacidiphilus oryzae]